MTSTPHERFLYDMDGAAVAHAPGRRDFFRVSDGTLFAHESHGWLLSAAGAPLAHRTGDIYFDDKGAALYRVTTEQEPPATSEGAPRGTHLAVASRTSRP